MFIFLHNTILKHALTCFLGLNLFSLYFNKDKKINHDPLFFTHFTNIVLVNHKCYGLYISNAELQSSALQQISKIVCEQFDIRSN